MWGGYCVLDGESNLVKGLLGHNLCGILGSASICSFRKFGLDKFELKLRYRGEGDFTNAKIWQGSLIQIKSISSIFNLLSSLPSFCSPPPPLLGTNDFPHIIFTMSFSSYHYSPLRPQSWKIPPHILVGLLAICMTLSFLAGRVFSPPTSIPTTRYNTISCLSTPPSSTSIRFPKSAACPLK